MILHQEGDIKLNDNKGNSTDAFMEHKYITNTIFLFFLRCQHAIHGLIYFFKYENKVNNDPYFIKAEYVKLDGSLIY